jgi:hypothetical protein
MNEHPGADRQLELLAARLSSLAPKLTGDEQRELLYRCAFGAGEKSARRRAAFWRNMCAGLAVLFCGTMAFTVGRAVQQVASSEPPREITIRDASSQATDARTVVPSPVRAPVDEPPGIIGGRMSLKLEGWTARPDRSAAFDEAFDRFQKLDPAVRAQSVSAMRNTL